ncbi:MAG: hypothetical protein J6Q13_01025, partial [Clostridia bacterium]|nr:hypothetical protein [Clostridia bacterium]
MKSKTIILSSEHQTGRGILTLYQEENLLQCRIRLYNTPKLNRFCKIGIYHEKQVYSANLLEKNGVYTSSMVGSFNIDQDFYAALIDTSNNNDVILSGGTYAGYFFNDNSIFNSQIENKFERIEKENPNTNIYNYNDDCLNSFESETNIFTQCNEINNKNIHNNIINKNQYRDDNSHNDNNTQNHKPNTCYDYNNQNINKQSAESEVGDNQTTKEREIQKCDEDCEKCKNCVYKEYFYSQNVNISKDTIRSPQPVDTTDNYQLKQNKQEQCSIEQKRNISNENQE